MTVAILPYPKFRAFTSANAPLSGGKVYTYEVGTSTPKATYTDSTGTAANANPTILDANGEANIWLNGAYKVVLKDANDVQLWSNDNISIMPYQVLTNQEWLDQAGPFTYISATQFSITNNQTATYNVGRRIKATVSAGIVYGVITTSVYTSFTTVTITLDSGSLDSGLSVVALGILSGTNPSIPKIQMTASDGTALAHLGTLGQLQKGGIWYGADAANTNAYVLTLTPAPTAYVAGMKFTVLITNANTITTPTLNVNGLGTKGIQLKNGVALVAGDIAANYNAEFVYNGSSFDMQNPYISRQPTPGTVINTTLANGFSFVTVTTQIPYDNTIPQITEGTEVMSVSYTPKYATSNLLVEADLFGAVDAAGRVLMGAMFRDTTANAISASGCIEAIANEIIPIHLVALVPANSVSATTFRVRQGTSTGTSYFNGNNIEAKFGGVQMSNIKITEIAA